MPFQNAALSSLSVALLATVLRRQQADVDEAYLHLNFAALMGRARYQRIAERGAATGLSGELLFALAYRDQEADEKVEPKLRALFGAPRVRRALLDNFATEALSAIERFAPELVGFTTSFHQTFPSLWLARLIKARWPATVVVFGGAACADPMGRRLAESYPEVDHVVDGFGEDAIVDLAHDRRRELPRVLRHLEPPEMDASPIPDYDRFMNEVRARHADGDGLMLAFESSRGCWWGQKVHCTFCGLNQTGMRYHSKSSERVTREVRWLWDRHRAALFATDTILSRNHLKEALPRLAAYEDKPTIFYEVKVNMTAAEVRTLREANVVWIQPGIESLSSVLLQRLRKGAKAIQNVALLKWCREQGITVSWGLLCGIPGECGDDYEAQMRMMRHLVQLAPPQGVSPVRIDRYSPYFDRHDEFGWTRVEPFAEYSLLHAGLARDAVHDLAYHVVGEGKPVDTDPYLARLTRAVARWKRAHLRGDGLFWSQRSGVLLRWREGTASEIAGDPRLPDVIAATHEIVAAAEMMARTGCDESMLQSLLRLGIVMREGSQVINLAVRLEA
jgi:magnesium-protoporphyrin IX monomethyl ester (oxidative) cyclase